MNTLRIFVGFASLWMLTACGGPPETGEALAFDGPYRDASDVCQLVSDTRYTDRFRGLRGDIVACPETMPRLDRFAAETGAVAVDRVGGYVLYAVPASGA